MPNQHKVYSPFFFRWIRGLYEWVLKWADTKYAIPALCILAFCESSFFPVPPEVLLIAIGITRPRIAIQLALLTTIFSVLGGMFGYLIGYEFMGLVGWPIVDFYGLRENFEKIQEFYQKYDAWAVGIAALTPIPYKVFTIAAGAFKINFAVFCIASFCARGVRYVLIGWLIKKYGAPIRDFIDKYFNLLSILFVVLVICGYLALKFLF